MSYYILFQRFFRQIFSIVPLISFFVLSSCSAQAANPLDSWHQRNCPLPNAALTSIAYGNGRFVVNADSINRVLTSTNGSDWEVHPAPYPNLRALTFGNGVFLAWFIAPQASLPQRIYSSPDGVVWTLRLVAPDYDVDFRAVRAANGKFVAAGTSVWLSSDLTNWTPTVEGTIAFTDLAYLNGNFVACDGSSIWSSPDAIGWTFRGSSTGGSKVAAGNGRFCIVGYPSGRTLVSPDGISWSQNPTTNVPPPFTLGPLAFTGGFFIGLGNTATSTLMSSTNAVDWEPHSFGTNWQAYGIAFGNNTFVAVGNGSVIMQSDIASGTTPTPPSLAIGQVPNLVINGESGRDYRIEYTDDLSNGDSFQPLATVHMEADQMTWVDVTATNAIKRFYRAVVLQ